MRGNTLKEWISHFLLRYAGSSQVVRHSFCLGTCERYHAAKFKNYVYRLSGCCIRWFDSSLPVHHYPRCSKDNDGEFLPNCGAQVLNGVRNPEKKSR